MRIPSRILIADDEELLLDVYRSSLAGQGHEILTAVEGNAALALARESQPDLVLLDLVMPGLDGLEVCRRIKADPALPFIPIIINTGGKRELRDVIAGLEAGADDYILKPFSVKELLSRLKGILKASVRPASR